MDSYIITGIVQKGQQKGGQLGAKTANLSLGLAISQDLPKGLYFGNASVMGKIYPALLYYGINYLSKHDCLEAHLVDFSDDLYGQEITVTTKKFLRPPIEFASVEELKEQITKDLEGARVV